MNVSDALPVSRECDAQAYLLQACKDGQLKIVKSILSHGQPGIINCHGESGRTPVMMAASKSDLALFNYLVRHGADVSAVNNFGNSVLHLACMGANTDIVRTLVVDKKYDVNKRGWRGKTPIMKAAEFGHKELFDFLVGKGCNLTVVDDKGNTVLHSASIGGNIEIVKFILSIKIVSLHSKETTYGRTPIMKAVECGHIELFEFLASKGPDLRTLDSIGNNILHISCIAGHVAMVQHLLSLNIVSVESRGFLGRTPVITAAVFGHLQVVKFLRSKGCNLQAVDNEGNTILHVACIRGSRIMVNYIITENIISIESRGVLHRTPVMLAVEYGQKRVISYLVSKGCNLSAVDGDGNTILHIPCLVDHVNMVRYLMSQKAIQGMEKVKNKNGNTPVQAHS